MYKNSSRLAYCSFSNIIEQIHVFLLQFFCIEYSNFFNIRVTLGLLKNLLFHPLRCSNRPAGICKISCEFRAPSTSLLKFHFIGVQDWRICCANTVPIYLLSYSCHSRIPVLILLLFFIYLYWFILVWMFVITQIKAIFKGTQVLCWIWNCWRHQKLNIFSLFWL